MKDSSTQPEPKPSADRASAADPSGQGGWPAWLPWLLAAAFAGCSLLLAGLALSLRAELRAAKSQGAGQPTASLATTGQAPARAAGPRPTAQPSGADSTPLLRQLLRRAVEAERQKAALEKQVREQTAAHAAHQTNWQRHLAAKQAEVQTLQEALAQTLAARREQLGRTRIVVLTAPAASAPAAVGVALWDEAERCGIVQVEHLPPPPPGRAYQLWLHDPKYPVPISAGVLRAGSEAQVRQRFEPAFPIEKLLEVSITLEAPGGSDTPRGPVILAGR